MDERCTRSEVCSTSNIDDRHSSQIQSALKAFNNIRYLLDDDHWKRDTELSFRVFLRLAELNLWSGM
jgi:hypothetical protein